MFGKDDSKPAYRVKGSHVSLARARIDEQLGEGAFDKLAVSAGVGFPALLMPGGWYDAKALGAVLQRASGRLGRSVEALATEVATLNAHRDLTSIYKVFVRATTPTRLLSLTPMLWRNYVEFADVRLIENVPGRYRGECSGVPGELLHWAFGCWKGFLPPAVEMAGAKHCRASVLEHGPMPGRELHRFVCEIGYEL